MKTAFIFPGQGSQSVGMGKDLARRFQAAREVFAEADEALGFSISTLCFEGPEGDLQLTENTQPAVLTSSIACLRAIEGESGLRPEIYAGHSLGEYAALVAAGAMDFQDALLAVRARGRFMQEAVPPGEGAMVAIIGLEREDVESVCERAADGEVLAPANFNAPGQVVVSGHAGAVGRAAAMAKEAGARGAIPLKVSAPFHCPLMEEAGRRLDEALAGIPFGMPGVPVISNVEARPIDSAGSIRELLVRQVSSPVLWEESVRAMARQGIGRFVEVGPGRVLTGMVKRIEPGAERFSVEDSQDLEALTDLVV